MFGRLTLESLPFYSVIAASGAAVTVLGGLAVVGAITYFGAWRLVMTQWVSSVDHKKIGIMYIMLALVMLLRGFVDAAMMRSQQAIALNNEGYLPPDHFDQIFSSHGTIMIFFMAMPFLSGLANLIVPQQIGSRDVAFPFMNSVSLWLTTAGAGLMLISLVVGKFSTAGWTGYPPYSGVEYTPGVGVDYWLWMVFIAGFGTTMTGINFLVTIFKCRAPGMTMFRLPLFTWTMFITSVLIIFAFPALTVACGMLILDRNFGFHFFTNGMGGNMMNYINLFWLWGHPEVYILILPAFGVFSEVVSVFSQKRLFGYISLVCATIAIGLLSFTVWLHHFFTMGSSARVNSFFGTMTTIISVPTGVKVFDWLLTMYRGRIIFKPPMLFTIGFLVTFVIGGLSGVLLALPPIDYMMHNTTFLVAHFHNMIIPGVLFGYLAGYMYWFPKAFGFKLNERWGTISFWCWIIGFYVAFMPLYVLGLLGMPRRMEHYEIAAWQPHLIAAWVGAFIIMLGLLALAVQLVVSVRERKQALDLTGDPWNGRSLEWATSSPAAPYNFAVLPKVESREAWWNMKQRGVAYRRPEKYEDIVMPKNTYAGLVIGVAGGVFGFAAIWWMWWLAFSALAVIVGTIIYRASDDDDEFVMTASEVKAIEDARFAQLAKAPKNEMADEPGFAGEAAPEPAT
ncbi:MAG: cbb3-type cytochrome c oxidase subunit I [Methyloceanibacter sp.]|uniref:cbb3-type cytochrome c oxidase subunit I n=1 Tax=Methyloceanibacter sp. TaxID=1965321 RepID=UPI003C385886